MSIPPAEPDDARDSRISRRRLLAGGLAAGAGVVLGGVAGFGLARADQPVDPQSVVVPFHGLNQAGVATAAQERLQFAAFDVLTTDRAEVRGLLQAWTAAAQALTVGQTDGDPGSPQRIRSRRRPTPVRRSVLVRPA